MFYCQVLCVDRVLCIVALKRFRGVSDVSHDLAEMQHEVQQQKLDPEWSFMKLLRTKSLRRPLVIVCFLAMSQQLSGINVVSIHGNMSGYRSVSVGLFLSV